MRHLFSPLRLQFFAGEGAGTAGNGEAGAGQQQNAAQQTQVPTIDYEKIAQLVAGKQAVAEDSVLKGYFKQQGLSEDEMKQAIAAFKQQKAASQPDVNDLQTQAAQYQAAAQKAQLEQAATMAAVGLGLDAKTIPYVLKMADFGQVTGQDGKINEETLKNALNKVLEDIPALKPQAAGGTGFIQVGAGGNGQQGAPDQEALKKAFGL